MDIEIRPLTPDLAEEYARFFDTTPHDDCREEHRCYCVPWCSDDCSGDYEARYLSSAEKRRQYAIQCVKNGAIRGYLAYAGGKVVGWCNANDKADCQKCYGWRRYLGYVPAEASDAGIQVKSVFCFTVAPEMKRHGVATRLLQRVCNDAAQEGFDFVEAYPNREPVDEALKNCGPIEMYRKCGFSMCLEAEQGFVMRKQLNFPRTS